MPLPTHSCTTSTGLIPVPREAACPCLCCVHFRASAAYIHAPHTTLASCACVNVPVEPALPCLVCLHPHACREAPLQHYHVTSQTWCLHFCAYTYLHPRASCATRGDSYVPRNGTPHMTSGTWFCNRVAGLGSAATRLCIQRVHTRDLRKHTYVPVVDSPFLPSVTEPTCLTCLMKHAP